MGIIDTTGHTLICRACNITEVAKVDSKGLGWSGTSWQPDITFEKFTVTWTGGGATEPVLASTVCKNCGSGRNTGIQHSIR